MPRRVDDGKNNNGIVSHNEKDSIRKTSGQDASDFRALAQ